MEKKKKINNFIIPASYFADKSTPETSVKIPKKINSPEEQSAVPISSSNKKLPEYSGSHIPHTVPKISISQRQSSGLSLKSIERQKAHQIKQLDVQIDSENLPNDKFSESQLLEQWKIFVERLEAQGRYNLAAILKIDTPKLQDDFSIALEFPNSTNKIEVERQQTELLQFLRKALNNFSLSLDISINETLEKRYAYTPQERYDKLKEKNRAIEELKQVFDLDL